VTVAAGPVLLRGGGRGADAGDTGADGRGSVAAEEQLRRPETPLLSKSGQLVALADPQYLLTLASWLLWQSPQYVLTVASWLRRFAVRAVRRGSRGQWPVAGAAVVHRWYLPTVHSISQCVSSGPRSKQ
jgi:hypothetical protein